MNSIHGGDIYRNKTSYDFSVSLNPLGCPEEILSAVKKAADRISEYPDIEQERARVSIADFYGIESENVLCSNGASELLMAIANMKRPKKALLTAPSFYGYEYALNAIAGCEITYHYLLEKDDFRVTKDILDEIEKAPDIVFLCNPNNPTGQAIDGELLNQIIDICEEKDILLVLDECFQELSDTAVSMTERAVKSRNLILVKAFTKLFSIPGVRLGFAIASKEMIDRLRRQLPEWNISVFAEEAVAAACGMRDHIEKTRAVIGTERKYLLSEFESIGIRAFASDSNFILFKTDEEIFDPLCQRGILIRDCSNFEGLGKGFYRIGIKEHKCNEELIDKLKEVLHGA